MENQSEEILILLRGKAKDVVRFGVKNLKIDLEKNPDDIFKLLHKHFSAKFPSSLPLANFYSTLPTDQEVAYDYWLRLNKAAELVSRSMGEQGKTFDEDSIEVTQMFIQNCPSKDLKLIFRSKMFDKWSANEAQDIQDQYHMEKSNMFSSPIPINKIQVSPASDSQVQTQNVTKESATMERLIDMLEKVLLQNSKSARSSRPMNIRSGMPRVEGLNVMPCSVCNDNSHSAFTHCREQKLCFLCHLPDHSRRSCLKQRDASGNFQLEN